MGIVNINDDSFSGDGTLDVSVAMETARAMVAEGADVIDVGGESARTNRNAISVQAEIDRVLPFVAAFKAAIQNGAFQPRDKGQVFPPVLSINTWRPEVAAATLAAGGELLNDMGALADDQNARLCAKFGAALLIMHSVGLPKVPHTTVCYPDVMEALGEFFEQKIAQAVSAGVRSEQILLDPGIDFAKQKEDNLRIYRHLDELQKFKRPILLPVSRKTVIGDVLNLPVATERDPGTVACIIAGLDARTAMFRVHNVRAAWQTIRTWEAVAAGMPG